MAGRYESKTILEFILKHADDASLDALLMNPDLQFLYPVKGLEWVIYAGKGLCNKLLEPSGLLAFDPQKIKGIRYLRRDIPIVEDDLIMEDLKADPPPLRVDRPDNDDVTDPRPPLNVDL